MSDTIAIIYASGMASLVATFVSNPLEVLKIRQQISGLDCRLHNQTQQHYNYGRSQIEYGHSQPTNNFRYVHSVAFKPPAHYNWMDDLMRRCQGYLRPLDLIQKITRIDINQISCNCINSNSLTQSIKQIYKKEGPRTFFNGLRYALIQATLQNTFYYTFYEKSKKVLKQNNIQHERITIPLLAGVTFPLEYWKTLQSSSQGYSKKKNMELGRKLNSGYAVTLQRDLIFSCVFWSILENVKIELTQLPIPIEVVNLISGVVAGVTTATLTLPLDQVKTRKQVSTRFDMVQQGKEMSTLQSLRDIIDKEGVQGLFKGYKPRMMKVTVHAGLVYMMYEYLKESMMRQ